MLEIQRLSSAAAGSSQFVGMLSISSLGGSTLTFFDQSVSDEMSSVQMALTYLGYRTHLAGNLPQFACDILKEVNVSPHHPEPFLFYSLAAHCRCLLRLMAFAGERLASSRYQEDINPAGHQSVWGSWFDSDRGVWGFACCKATTKDAPACTSLPTLPQTQEEALPESGGAKKDSETTWRPRGDFETSQGFVVHASIYLASQWLKCLQDGTLSTRADCFDVDVRKVLLSEQAAKESLEQVKKFGRRLDDGKVPQKLAQSLEEFCSCVGEREYVKANKAYMDIVMGARKWQGDVPYLVEGNRNGPSVVQNVAERINKVNSNPVDEAGIRDHAVLLRRLMKVAQVVRPNEDPSRNCG
eukprot:s187_g24.t1